MKWTEMCMRTQAPAESHRWHWDRIATISGVKWNKLCACWACKMFTQIILIEPFSFIEIVLSKLPKGQRARKEWACDANRCDKWQAMRLMTLGIWWNCDMRYSWVSSALQRRRRGWTLNSANERYGRAVPFTSTDYGGVRVYGGYILSR